MFLSYTYPLSLVYLTGRSNLVHKVPKTCHMGEAYQCGLTILDVIPINGIHIGEDDAQLGLGVKMTSQADVISELIYI